MHRDKSLYLIQNVDIALKILLLIAKEPKTIEEVWKEVGIREDKAEKLIHTLLEREWLSQEADGDRLMLGVKCFELGRAYFQHLDIREVAKPILKRVALELQENAYLTTRIGYEVLYIEKHEVEREVGILSRFGRVLPMYASASGKIFLAHFDHREVEDYFKKVKWVKHTSRTKTPQEVREELPRIRERGYSINMGEYEEDVVSVASPVYDYTGKVNYTVSVVAPAYRVSESALMNRFKEVTISASEELSREIGTP